MFSTPPISFSKCFQLLPFSLFPVASLNAQNKTCISSLGVLDIRFKRTTETDSMAKNMYGRKHREKKKDNSGRQTLVYQGNPDLPFS